MSSLSEFDNPAQNVYITVDANATNVAGLVEELGRFAAASRNIVGVLLQGKNINNGSAFVGGHTTKYRDDYGTVSVELDTHDGIRQATQLIISEERAAEIANTYVPPERLKHPTNHVDAFIGYIIKKLVGYEDDRTDSFQEQAEASADTLLAIPGTTEGPSIAYMLGGEVNLSNAQQNAMYRARQVEAMEHVLRFLIARKQARPYSKGNFEGGVEYHSATGLLAEAVEIVNGTNTFNESSDPASNDLLYRGLLPQKSSLVVKDKVLCLSDVTGPVPIWPPEAVQSYEAEKVADAQKIAAKRQQEVAARAEESRTAKEAALLAQQCEIQLAMVTLVEQGYAWRGIVVMNSGVLDTVDKIKTHYAQKYDVSLEDVSVVEDVSIYGGTNPAITPGSASVYIRNIPSA